MVQIVCMYKITRLTQNEVCNGVVNDGVCKVCPSLTVSMRVSVQERHGDVQETVAETDPRAGAVWLTYRNENRGSKTIQTLGFVYPVANTDNKL